MEVKFDLVRIGNVRKNKVSETILKDNTALLKLSIRSLLKDIKSIHKNNRVDMIMIVPAKGYVIKIRTQEIKDINLRKILSDNFPNNIYKGSLDTILDNSDKRVIFR